MQGGREGVKPNHSSQFEAFSEIAAFLLFAEFPVLFQCCSPYPFLTRNNNFFNQRNGWGWERRGPAAGAGQLQALVCLHEQILSCNGMPVGHRRAGGDSQHLKQSCQPFCDIPQRCSSRQASGAAPESWQKSAGTGVAVPGAATRCLDRCCC